MLTLYNTGQSPVVLELVERLLQHVLRVYLLHTKQVEHHVVGQVEGTVQRIGRALYSNKKNKKDFITPSSNLFLITSTKDVRFCLHLLVSNHKFGRIIMIFVV